MINFQNEMETQKDWKDMIPMLLATLAMLIGCLLCLVALLPFVFGDPVPGREKEAWEGKLMFSATFGVPALLLIGSGLYVLLRRNKKYPPD